MLCTYDMNETIPEIPDFTTHDLISSFHDGLREAVDFVQSQIIGTLRGQINLSQQERAIMGIRKDMTATAHWVAGFFGAIGGAASVLLLRIFLQYTR